MTPIVNREDNPRKGIAYTLTVIGYNKDKKAEYFEELKNRRKEEDKKLRYIK